jgi:hypothetical protein
VAEKSRGHSFITKNSRNAPKSSFVYKDFVMGVVLWWKMPALYKNNFARVEIPCAL